VWLAKRIEFDYEINAHVNARIYLFSGWNGIGGSNSQEWSEGGAGIGSINSGSVIVSPSTFFKRNACWFRVSQGSDYTYTTETGEAYLKVSNVRIKGKDQATITARDVIVDVLDDTNTVTGTTDFTPLSRSSDEIIDPGIDLDEAIYEDMDRSALITNLSQQGDTGTSSATWYADIEALDISSSMTTLINQVYVVYRDARGQRVITSATSDEESVATYDVRRETVLSSLSENATIADIQRDVFLDNHKDMSVQATFQIANIENGFGGSVMPWHVRSGDEIVLRNVTQTGLGDVLNFSRFRIVRTRYDVINNILELEPSFSSPTIRYLSQARQLDT
jgi:hypothetical protein